MIHKLRASIANVLFLVAFVLAVVAWAVSPEPEAP
jgi:hypothetical protein